MILIVHDFPQESEEHRFLEKKQQTIVISEKQPIRPCVGCFGCWVKTPGECVIRDTYGDMGKLLSRCTELWIISRCVYGSYSPFIKNVIDRSISYNHPDFVIRNDEMHHRRRYLNRFFLKVIFYGEDISTAERTTAKGLVQANALNFDCDATVVFISDKKKIKEVLA